jgi:hypothetical protein
MVVNATCHNCLLWSIRSTAAPMIFAVGPALDLSSDDKDARIRRHSAYGQLALFRIPCLWNPSLTFQNRLLHSRLCPRHRLGEHPARRRRSQHQVLPRRDLDSGQRPRCHPGRHPSRPQQPRCGCPRSAVRHCRARVRAFGHPHCRRPGPEVGMDACGHGNGVFPFCYRRVCAWYFG